MIFYFSATGNCKYVAERIAAARGDKTVSVADCCKSGSFSFEKTGKTVGIISPTYAWGLPVIVREFLQKLTLNTKPDYLWFAATYGIKTRFAAPTKPPRDKSTVLSVQ